MSNKTYIFGMTLLLLIAGLTHASLRNKTDGEFVTLTGKVISVEEDAFKLRVNNRVVEVEMDDNHWDADGYRLVTGDQVVVNGRVDHDFFEKKKVEASSIYVKGLNAYFYASSEDEEDSPFLSSAYMTNLNLEEGASVDLQGRVKSVTGREFILDTGRRLVRIDTDELIYNPVDDKGYTQIAVGDRVRVSGEVDDDYLDGKEIDANFVTEL